MHARMTGLLRNVYREVGWRSRVSALLGGLYVAWKIRREERRLAGGWTYEPPTFYEVNEAVDPGEYPTASQCSYVTSQVADPSASPDELSSALVPGAFQVRPVGKLRPTEAVVTSSASDSER